MPKTGKKQANFALFNNPSFTAVARTVSNGDMISTSSLGSTDPPDSTLDGQSHMTLSYPGDCSSPSRLQSDNFLAEKKVPTILRLL